MPDRSAVVAFQPARVVPHTSFLAVPLVYALVVAVWAFPPPIVGAAFVYHSVGDTAAARGA